jgi:hypothetical protein
MIDGMETRTLIDRPATRFARMTMTDSVMPAIDEALARLATRELISAAEVINTLLDLRLIVAADEVAATR